MIAALNGPGTGRNNLTCPRIWFETAWRTTSLALASVDDYEHLARQIVPREVFPGLFSGRGHPVERADQNNLDAFDELVLRPRVMVDVSRRNLATKVLGQPLTLPVMLAPVSGHTGFHAEGELATVRAAGSRGTVFVLGTLASHSIEAVAAAATGPIWFQLYVLTDRSLVESLVRRAEHAGFSGLVITVDNKAFRFPPGGDPWQAGRAEPKYANFMDPEGSTLLTPEIWSASKSQSFAWKDLDWIRSITAMPIIIKGIQTGEDAALCVELGVDAIVVSNHGGWALYGAAGTARILPEVVDAVGGRVEIYLDGGVRRGTDVLKAVALGAKAVLIGRAMIWGLVADGEDGVRGVLDILRGELDDAMGLCGVTDLTEVSRSLVRRI